MTNFLEQIALKHMGFRDLQTRNSDTLDFREVSVWNVKRALEEAYALGKNQSTQFEFGTVQCSKCAQFVTIGEPHNCQRVP